MLAAIAAVRLTEVLHVARKRGASDVHLCPGMPPVFRIDGELDPMDASVVAAEEIAQIAKSLLSEPEHRRFDSHGDITGMHRDSGGGRVRVHAYQTANGCALALRLLALSVPSLETLHVPPAVASFCDLVRGLVLITGPTGSGKSTLTAAIVDRINRTHSKHIITIEDPVEYEHSSVRSLVSQRQILVHAPAFDIAVHGALRSDPDVLVIGEIRDPETMHAALTAAETGHLVLTTLHTGDAGQTIDRIVGAFQAEMQQQVRVQLAQTLAGVVCVRLVSRAQGGGRVCAAEILVANDAVRHLIRDGKTHQIKNVLSTGRHAGMQTLEAHLADLTARGEITAESARAV